MSTPVDTQIMHAVRATLQAANLGAGIHVDRTDADPFELTELPAINLIAVEESISTPSLIGAAHDGVLQTHSFQLVVQVVVQQGGPAADGARLISASATQALAADPTLGGLCSGALRPVGKQWLLDDGAERPLARQNTLWLCGYRTNSRDPFTPI